MPDISMCTNKECPLSHKCWRFNCLPNQYWQSYTKFEPYIDEKTNEIICEYFFDMPEKSK